MSPRLLAIVDHALDWWIWTMVGAIAGSLITTALYYAVF